MIIGIDASKLVSQNPTGVEISTRELIKALLQLDTENIYRLYSPVPLGSEWLQFDNVKNIVVPAKKLWTLWGLSREIKKRPPEIFWSPSNFLPYNLPPKSVATIHDLAAYLFPKSYSLIQYWLSRLALHRAIKSATKLIAVSQQTKKDLKRYFHVPGENIEVIYHSLRTDFNQPAVDIKQLYPELDKYFICVGRLELRKNLINLIKAFAKFNAQTAEPIKLLLVGSKSYGYARIIKTIKRLKLTDKVIIKGYIPAEHLLSLYQSAIANAFVSQYEGFGLNILEGFAARVPVITANSGAMSEIAGKAALLVNPSNIDAITDSLHQVTDNPALRQALIDKGLSRLKDFSWEQSAQKLINLWKNL